MLNTQPTFDIFLSNNFFCLTTFFKSAISFFTIQKNF